MWFHSRTEHFEQRLYFSEGDFCVPPNGGVGLGSEIARLGQQSAAKQEIPQEKCSAIKNDQLQLNPKKT